MPDSESLSFGGQFRISLPRVGPASARRPTAGSRVASFLCAEESPAPTRAQMSPSAGAPRRSERPGRRPSASAVPPRGVAARLDFEGAADDAAARPRAASSPRVAAAWAGAQTPRAEARATPRAETVRVPSRGEEPRLNWSPAVAASPGFDDDALAKCRPVPDPAAFGDAAAAAWSPCSSPPEREPAWRRRAAAVAAVSAAAEASAHARSTGAEADARARRSAPRAAPPPRVASSLDATKVLIDAAHDAPAWVRAAAAADDAAAAAASDASTDDAAEDPRGPRPAPPKRRRTRRTASDAPRRDVRLARDFVLVGRCGRGAFSDVWTATSTVDGESYAIKVARRPFRSRRAREAALAECEALRALRGAPNVIAFHLAWQEGGHLHAQLELCALGSIAQIVSRNGDAPEAPHLWKLPAAARKEQPVLTSSQGARAHRVSCAGWATSATHSCTFTRAVTSTATSSRATSSSMRGGS